MKNKNDQNMFFYIGTSILISVIAVLIIASCFLFFCYRAIYTEFIRMNENAIISIAEQHEGDMEIIDRVIIQIDMLDETTRFKRKEDPLKTKILRDKLKSYTVTNNFYDMILYHYREDDSLYNQSSSIVMERFLEDDNILEDVSVEEFKEILEGKIPFISLIPEQYVTSKWLKLYLDNDARTVVFTRVLTSKKDEVLLFFVPSGYYDQLLINNISVSNAFACLYKAGEIIVSRGGDESAVGWVREFLINNQIENQLDSNSVMQKDITIGETKYLLSIIKGDSGICYIMLQDMNTFYHNLSINSYLIMLVVVIALVFVFISILIFSRELLRTIKKMSNLLKVDTKYNLNRIEGGIHNLIEKNKDAELHNMVLEKRRFVRTIISECYKNREEIIAEAQRVHLEIDFDKYIVVLVRCSGKKTNTIDIYNSFIEKQSGIGGYGVDMIGRNQLLFFLAADEKEVIERCLDGMWELEKDSHHNIIVAVSDYHTDFKETSVAYLEATIALEYHPVISINKIVYFNNVVKEENFIKLPDNYVKRLKTAVYGGNKDAIDEQIVEIYNVVKDKNPSLYSVRIFYNNIFQMLLTEKNVELVKEQMIYNVFNLTKCYTLQSFHDLLCDFCTVLSERRKMDEKSSDIVKNACYYMKAHYDDPELTISLVAEDIGVNLEVLSIEFKNNTSMSPSEYLIYLRMEKAKEFLDSTNMTIKEIGIAVGYYDESAFFRRFKRYAGMTPGQYREKKK